MNKSSERIAIILGLGLFKAEIMKIFTLIELNMKKESIADEVKEADEDWKHLSNSLKDFLQTHEDSLLNPCECMGEIVNNLLNYKDNGDIRTERDFCLVLIESFVEAVKIKDLKE